MAHRSHTQDEFLDEPHEFQSRLSGLECVWGGGSGRLEKMKLDEQEGTRLAMGHPLSAGSKSQLSFSPSLLLSLSPLSFLSASIFLVFHVTMFIDHDPYAWPLSYSFVAFGY